MNMTRLPAFLGMLLAVGWPSWAGAGPTHPYTDWGGGVFDGLANANGTPYGNGNLFANDTAGSGMMIHKVWDPQGNELPWTTLIGGKVVFTGSDSWGGTLRVWQATGNYTYTPPPPHPSGNPGGAYHYEFKHPSNLYLVLGGSFIGWPFRVHATPALSALDVEADLIGMAENAAPLWTNNPPGARTVQMGVGDFMDRSFPAVRVSGASNQEVAHFYVGDSIYERSQIEFVNTDFESEEGMVITDSFDVESEFYGEGTVQGTALIAPRAGLYRFEAAAGVGMDDFDSESEETNFAIELHVVKLVKFGSDYLFGAWAGESWALYPMDPGETGSNTAHLALTGHVRLAAGDGLMVELTHSRDLINGPVLDEALMHVDESMPRFPYFQMQWISD